MLLAKKSDGCVDHTRENRERDTEFHYREDER
jgi:hypothetical protein